MKLLVGLGNPGRKYSNTRHNIGFVVVETVARKFGISLTKEKFASFFGIGNIGELEICIIEPQTFMNLSGEATNSFAGYYKIKEQDILVVHDDLDIVPGKIKLSYGSGSGGHNGVASIVEKLGTNEFWRLKVGIGRAPENVDPADYVLGKFSKTENEVIDKVTRLSADAVCAFYSDGAEKAMQKYHSSL